MGKLSGRTAIVTGATSGMGRRIAEVFASEGASVVVSGRDTRRGADVADSIRSDGGRAVFVKGDVAVEETNRLLVERALNGFGGLDILVPNAGILGMGSITAITPDDWRRTMAVNLDAVFHLLHHGLPVMRRLGGGAVVVTGSIAAHRAFPNHPAYCASKGALVALVRQTALDYAPDIRLNIINPGQVETPLLHDSAAAFPDPEGIIAETAGRLPLKRLGTVDDIARAALFLASDDSSWITGSALTIDGGGLCAC